MKRRAIAWGTIILLALAALYVTQPESCKVKNASRYCVD